MGLLPAFANLFGLKPWDVDRLTYGEAAQFRQFARKHTTKE